MRVIFLGFQTWGHRTLQALLDSHHEVALVVTHPPGQGVYERIWSDSVEELATRNGIPVLLRNRPDDDELYEAMKAADADVMVATNWRTWIPPRLFSLPRRGTLNVHDSLLPKYAGFAPLAWALINGEKEVGVTAHIMDETLDAGPIVLQWAVPVGDSDTTTDLFARTLDLFGPITVEALDLIATGRTDWTPQDRGRASFFHKRSEEDIRIDWRWPAEDLERLVRAQSAPYPQAFCFHGRDRLEIVSAAVSNACYGGTPGRIFYREGDGVAIVAGAEARRGTSKALLLRRVRTAAGDEMPAADYFTKMGGYLTSHPVA